jgi:hypothetical protein
MWNDLRYYPTDILKDQMQDCLEAEDYRHCARIRDELKRRNNKIKFNETILGKTINFFIYVLAVLLIISLASWVITSIGNFINSLFR